MGTAHEAAVLGAGSWGTALAIHLGQAGRPVALWGRDDRLIEAIRSSRVNPTYLAAVPCPDAVMPTNDVSRAVAGARFVVVAVPSHGLRAAVRAARPHLDANAILVSATKGLEVDSLERMSEVIREETGGQHAVVVLSGPSFALEVARGLPTALVAASVSNAAVQAVQDELRGPAFRLYGSDDVVGVEIGGALKNVMAIAAGVVESLDLGHNARSALITRGLAETSRLACAMGGRPETLAGLSGLGDLVLTCTGSLSRNRHVGIELGRGKQTAEIVSGMRMVAEGVNTTEAALALGARYDVELPIASQMAEVLGGRRTPLAAVTELMVRPQRGERDRR